jgi:hypothetical protein
VPHIARALTCARILVAAASLAGCSSVIIPPTGVREPASIAVLDHGRHSSLLLDAGDGSMVRYAYGDWQWYALQQTGPIEASTAVLLRSKAALGRKRLPGPVSPDGVARNVRVGVEEAYFLEVETSAARDLIARLDGIFFASIDSRVVNEAYDLEFVPDPEPYTFFSHNSNSVVAEWLRALGCRVEGTPLFATWNLQL